MASGGRPQPAGAHGPGSAAAATQQDVMSFLADLDAITGPPASRTQQQQPRPGLAQTPNQQTQQVGANQKTASIAEVAQKASSSKEILNFLDEISSGPLSGPPPATAAVLTPTATTTAPPLAPQVRPGVANPSAGVTRPSPTSVMPPPTSSVLQQKPCATAAVAMPVRPPPVTRQPVQQQQQAPTPSAPVQAPASAYQQPNASASPAYTYPIAKQQQQEQKQEQQQKVQQEQQEQSSDGPRTNWSWNSLLTTAARGIGSAKAMASQTAHAVTSNEHVRELYAGVAPEINRLGTDLTNLAKISVSTIADTIAPPIFPRNGSDGAGGRYGTDADGVFAHAITVWLCVDTPEDDVLLDRLHEFVQVSVNDMWLKPYQPAVDPQTGRSALASENAHRTAASNNDADDNSHGNLLPKIVSICDKVIVNSAKDPEPTTISTLQDAVVHAEAIIERLQKLADQSASTTQPPPPTDGVHHHQQDPPQYVFVVVQPFSVVFPASQLSDASTHTHYYCLLVCDAGERGLISLSSLSQSVMQRGNSTAPQNVANDSAKTADHWTFWEQTLHRRVIETALADLFEEFIVAAKYGV